MYRPRNRQQCINMFSWGRTVLLLSVTLASLQLLYLVLLGRLEVHTTRTKESRTVDHQQQQQIYPLVSLFNEAIKSSHVIDTSGQYRIVYFLHRSDWDRRTRVTTGEHVINDDVTIVTQSSVNHLFHLLSLQKVWQGPISVAVFMAQAEAYSVLETIVMLVHCFPAIRDNVSIHLVCPLTSKDIPTIRSVTNVSCDSIRTGGIQLNTTDVLNYAAMAKYPNNLLRNVAKYGACTAYVFVIDIDMLPNTGLRTSFTQYLKQTTLERALDNGTVYVVPSFEINTNAAIPEQKEKLLTMWQLGLIRPFYYELCWKCQRYTEYDRWRNLKHDFGLQVSYEVKWQDPWEPFYIAPRNVPLFDERFKQYGFNRISQACELHIAGFRFNVLNNAFLVHHGYKKKTGFHLTKDIEQEQNRMLFRLFKEELKTKYADSTKRCY